MVSVDTGREGAADIAALLEGSGPRILSFDYDVDSGTFIAVRGEGNALHGYTVEQWQVPGFLDRCLSPDDRPGFKAALNDCRNSGREILRCCRLVNANDELALVYVIARGEHEVDGHFGLSGQILSIEQLLDAPERSAIRNGAGRELLQLISDQLCQNVRTLSGLSELLGRHLAAQNDDMGSEFVVEIGAAVSNLTLLAQHLRPLVSASRVSVADTEETLQALRGGLPLSLRPAGRP